MAMEPTGYRYRSDGSRSWSDDDATTNAPFKVTVNEYGYSQEWVGWRDWRLT